MQNKNSKIEQYTRRARKVIGIVMLLAFILGVVSNPTEYWASVSRIPTAFSVMVTWLVFTGAVVWFLVDMAAKKLLGKSLRELIVDKDPRFEQNLVVAMVVAIPIVMLVSR